jgi:hypothetical protein
MDFHFRVVGDGTYGVTPFLFIDSLGKRAKRVPPTKQNCFDFDFVTLGLDFILFRFSSSGERLYYFGSQRIELKRKKNGLVPFAYLLIALTSKLDRSKTGWFIRVVPRQD